MDQDRIGELLQPFLGLPAPAPLLAQLQAYLSLLVRWNQRIALTAVRDEENIVTRHFGESLFAARCWFPSTRGSNDVPRGTSADLTPVPRGTPAQETPSAPISSSALGLPYLNVPDLSVPRGTSPDGAPGMPTASERMPDSVPCGTLLLGGSPVQSSTDVSPVSSEPQTGGSAEPLPDTRNVPRGTLLPDTQPQSPTSVTNPVPRGTSRTPHPPSSILDIGSGAGFPGIPIKLYAPSIHLFLVEAHGKKATFLREVIRTIALKDVTVLNRRAEELLPNSTPQAECSTWNTSEIDANAECSKPNADCSTWNNLGTRELSHAPSSMHHAGNAECPQPNTYLVTLRAVENFSGILPTAAALVRPGGRLGLLIGSAQIQAAMSALPQFHWLTAIPIPLSTNRVVLTGIRQAI